jgi:hypothetical protein
LPSFDVQRLLGLPATAPAVLVVGPTDSIAAAIDRAAPGSEILVEPGEYRERITLRDAVRVVSRVPRGAIIRLPATDPAAAAPQPAVMAAGLARAEFAGFTIVGDARTPLGVGIHVASGGVALIDVEITGATDAAIVFAGDSAATLVGSEIHGNPGAAVAVRSGATPQLTQNVFHRNGLSQHAAGTFIIDPGAAPRFRRNVFLGTRPDAFALDAAGRQSLEAENWFLPAVHRTPAGAAAGRVRQP